MTALVPTEWRIDVSGETTTARFDPATAGPAQGVFVCAHGAGGHLGDRGMERLTQVLRSRGLHTVRFNFLYREKGSGRPDPMPRLTACLAAVVEEVQGKLAPERLFLGGRSMGGRAASMLVADGFRCDGLLLYAYPLHPPGKPTQLRDAHLPAIRTPVLCINGTRDDFCTRELMLRTLDGLSGRWTMHWLEGADHSFHVLKSSGRNDDAVLAEAADVTARWIAERTAG
ncbi:MAG TPA: alpha/beta family hydrolase [Gemmatimonadaceae bacterium]|nr:alpha/beta family hydrolase [Gemmatimonadaceae bacterium]